MLLKYTTKYTALYSLKLKPQRLTPSPPTPQLLHTLGSRTTVISTNLTLAFSSSGSMFTRVWLSDIAKPGENYPVYAEQFTINKNSVSDHNELIVMLYYYIYFNDAIYIF